MNDILVPSSAGAPQAFAGGTGLPLVNDIQPDTAAATAEFQPSTMSSSGGGTDSATGSTNNFGAGFTGGRPASGSPGGHSGRLIVYIMLAVLLLIGGFFLLNRSSVNSKLHNLQSQVATLEQKAKTGNFSAEAQTTLDKLQEDIKDLEAKTDNLPEDTKAQLTDLATRLDKLEASTSGSPGPKGATGTQGPQGPSGVASCPNGLCLSLQPTSPGIQETGSINISDDAIIGGNLTVDTNTLFVDSTNNRVGIGTASPGAKLQVTNSAAGTVGQIIKAAASQTADLQQWQNSSGSVLASINSAGNLQVTGNSNITTGSRSVSRTWVTVRTAPIVINDAVDIGRVSCCNDYILNVRSDGNGMLGSKAYRFSYGWGGGAGPWYVLRPSQNLAYTSNDFEVDYRWDGSGLNFRIRRTSGTATGDYRITLTQYGNGADFVESSSVASVTPPSGYSDAQSAAITEYSDSSGGANARTKVGIGVAAPTARLQVGTGSVGIVGQIIQGHASQTADLLQGQDSTGAVLYRFTAAGHLGIGGSPPAGSGLYVADGKYVQFEDNNAGTPPAADCDSDTERGRLSIDTTNNRLYICNGATRGWDYTTLTD